MGSLGDVTRAAISSLQLGTCREYKAGRYLSALLFLQHIKTNCELQQVLCGECVTQNFVFKDTACAVTLSGTIHMHIWKAARGISMHRL